MDGRGVLDLEVIQVETEVPQLTHRVESRGREVGGGVSNGRWGELHYQRFNVYDTATHTSTGYL